jgi:hypothetical protein
VGIKAVRQLRELGIYRTPDGRAHVARAGFLGSYLLFGLSGCVEGFPTYVVDLAGRVVAATQPTPWRSDELLDTGRTFHEIFATPRKSAVASSVESQRESGFIKEVNGS